jgi:hypothetical protein
MEEHGTRLKAENEAIKKAKSEKYESAMGKAYPTLLKYSPDKNYTPTEADQKEFARLVAEGMTEEAAANTIFAQKIKDEKIEKNKVPEANAKGLAETYGKMYTTLDPADQETIAAKVNGVLGKLQPEQKALLLKKPATLSDEELEEQWKLVKRINDEDWTFGSNANPKVVSFPSPVAQLYRANGIEGFRRYIIAGKNKGDFEETPLNKLFETRYRDELKKADANTLKAIESVNTWEKLDEKAPPIVKAAYYQYLINEWLKQANEYEYNK